MNKPTNTHSLDTNKERKRLLSYSVSARSSHP